MIPMAPSSRRRLGFTLVEALIALAVLATLITLALPTFGARLQHHRLRAAAEDLAQDLVEARHLAAQMAATVNVEFRSGTDWCYAVSRAPGCDCRQGASCALKIVAASDLPGLTVPAAAGARIDAQALSPGGPVAELASRSGERLRVEMTPLGRARICTPNGAAGYPGC